MGESFCESFEIKFSSTTPSTLGCVIKGAMSTVRFVMLVRERYHLLRLPALAVQFGVTDLCLQ